MDPLSAFALAIAAFFDWAKVTRETMKPELRDEHDRNVLQIWRDIKHVFNVQETP